MSSSKKICAVLMKNLCSLKVCYLVAHRCKKVNDSKKGRLRYEVIGGTQPGMELLEVATFIYSLFVKSREFNLICNQNVVLQHSNAGIYVRF